jgi:hypothetical protein
MRRARSSIFSSTEVRRFANDPPLETTEHRLSAGRSSGAGPAESRGSASGEPGKGRGRFEFAIAARDELWLRGRCVERLLTHGIARHRRGRIEASDAPDSELIRVCDQQMAEAREAAHAIGDGRVRAVASARRAGVLVVTETTMTITMRHVSIVTSAEFAAGDAAILRDLVATETNMRYRKLPVVWRNGSAAVLLHEAVGHAAEHDAPAVAWPEWLHVSDEPPYLVDDCGKATRHADLLCERPASFRRESFRDIPLQRMSTVVVRQDGASFSLPEERIEVQLVAGGNYDPLMDRVTVEVAVADLVARGRKTRLRPFTIHESREEVARSLAGAMGGPIRYPGVICSREGQEIAVGSHAPVILTL